jgi:hypothetical protein
MFNLNKSARIKLLKASVEEGKSMLHTQEQVIKQINNDNAQTMREIVEEKKMIKKLRLQDKEMEKNNQLIHQKVNMVRVPLIDNVVEATRARREKINIEFKKLINS